MSTPRLVAKGRKLSPKGSWDGIRLGLPLLPMNQIPEHSLLASELRRPLLGERSNMMWDEKRTLASP